MRSSKVALGVLLIAFAIAGIAAAFVRSTIPLAFDGPVDHIEQLYEKARGIDDVWIVYVDDRVIRVDAAIAAEVDEGDRISKDAWERTLHVSGREVRLALSDDTKGLALAATIAAIAGLVVMRRGVDR